MAPRAHGDAYVAGLSGASGLKIVRGAGHAAPLEQPEATAALLTAFLIDARSEPGSLQAASAS